MDHQEEGHSSSAPLLEKKTAAPAGGGGMHYEEGCPGCAVDRRKAANPGIPYGSFIYVWIVTLCTGTDRTNQSPCFALLCLPLLFILLFLLVS
jgi:hypothetical protein